MLTFYFINSMNFNAKFQTLMRVCFPSLHKIGVFLHPGKSHAQNGRSDSTPRILTLLNIYKLWQFCKLPIIAAMSCLVLTRFYRKYSNIARYLLGVINCDLFFRQNMASHYCGYELFGFDVLLDAKLKPWLIEVNISPSLHSSSPLDLDVKSPLATEVFNLGRFFVRFRFLSFFSSALNCAQRVSIFFVKSQRLLIEFPHLTSFFF